MMLLYNYGTGIIKRGVNMSIGTTIKLYRKDKNLTQSELAELIGVSTQAVSKWETDAGLPDISQIVPLARVLEVSTDKLLGNTDVSLEKEAEEIRGQIGGINLISCPERARNLYSLASKFYNKHPDVPDIAVLALETYISLYSENEFDISNEDFLENCERYAASIFRYETVADRVFKTHYLMARAYDLCGKEEKSQSYMQNLPVVYGFRDYWEAEFAFTNKRYDIALEKIKKSFAWHARFSSRCIRLAGQIERAKNPKDSEDISLKLDEYMLRIIEAYLSGGDYLPHRQIFQKTALLVGLVSQNLRAGNRERATLHYNNLLKTVEDFSESNDNMCSRESLMFIKGDMDGSHQTSKEQLHKRILAARNEMEKYL